MKLLLSLFVVGISTLGHAAVDIRFIYSSGEHGHLGLQKTCTIHLSKFKAAQQVIS
jgi:hypothetical protein